ncbi:MAG: HNH endonuclease [Campylobacter sp.]|nr:HNH endonuclease [Campylobacter sp.]
MIEVIAKDIIEKSSMTKKFNPDLRLDAKEFNKLNKFYPENNGKWEDEKGNGKWIPNDDYIPPNSLTNPEHLSWKELKEKYNIDGIEFKDGEPDFSPVSKGEVQIDNFTDSRADNFAQADEKLAEQKGCAPEEVSKWRKENNYTWHECGDCKTMQKVPTEIHGNVPHSGGIAKIKSTQGEANV